jgi:hypothetical protein
MRGRSGRVGVGVGVGAGGVKEDKEMQFLRKPHQQDITLDSCPRQWHVGGKRWARRDHLYQAAKSSRGHMSNPRSYGPAATNDAGFVYGI